MSRRLFGSFAAITACRSRRVTRHAGTAPAIDPLTQGFGRLSSLMVAAQITLSIALLNAALVVARGVAGYLGSSRTAGQPDDDRSRHRARNR